MENKSMTALVSAFSRAYHARNHRVKIFDDTLAEKLLLEEEYAMISKSMAQGAQFFFPGFEGSEAEALGRIVDAQLSPTPLGRTAFAQSALKTAVSIGARQYVILGAGYDTFAYRQPDWARSLELFELEQPATSRDKRERLARAAIEIPPNVHFIETDLNDPRWAEALWRHPAFDADKLTFCSLLGLVYYLSKESFGALLSELGTRLCKGSSLVFDYPDENSYTDRAGERAKKQALLARGAKEEMLAIYSYRAMEALLASRGFLIYERLTPEDMTEQYFKAHNEAEPARQMSALDNVEYCLAVKG